MTFHHSCVLRGFGGINLQFITEMEITKIFRHYFGIYDSDVCFVVLAVECLNELTAGGAFLRRCVQLNLFCFVGKFITLQKYMEE